MLSCKGVCVPLGYVNLGMNLESCLTISICFNLGQFDFFFFAFAFVANKKYFWHLRSSLHLLLLFISTLLTLPTIPSLISQHPNLYSFYLKYAYLGSLESQTFGFPLDSCPDALPLSHAGLDASSTIFLITYTL